MSSEGVRLPRSKLTRILGLINLKKVKWEAGFLPTAQFDSKMMLMRGDRSSILSGAISTHLHFHARLPMRG